MPPLSELAEALLELTRQAAQLACDIRHDLGIELKPDGSIVTKADKAIEAFLVPRLLELIPGAGIWGEEGTWIDPTDKGFWLIDPIDGTSNYAYNQHLWGVTVAYIFEGVITLGSIVMPNVDIALIAAKGQGCWLNGKRLPDIPEGRIEPFHLMGHGSTSQISKYEHIAKARHLGAFVAEAAYLCTQGLRAMTTNRVKLYDAAAGMLMVRELGGIVTYLDGQPFDESQWMKDVRTPPLYMGPRDSNFPFD